MSVQVQHRRDSATNLAGVTPAVAEIGYDTTNAELLYGDGTTVSGIKLAKKLDARPTTAAAAVVDTDTVSVNQGGALNVKQTYAAIKTWIKSWIVKADVGLGNVDNTSDVNKPVSTAQAAADALKAPIASPVFTTSATAPTVIATGSPSSVWALDASGATIGLVNNATADFAAGSGLVVVTDTSVTGSSAVFLVSGGGATLVAQTGTLFVASLTPSAGQVGLQYNGGTAAYRLKNAQGSSISFGIASIRTRNAS